MAHNALGPGRTLRWSRSCRCPANTSKLLEAFVASGQDFNATEAQAVEPDAIEEALEAARKQIASDWDVKQEFEQNQPVLVAKKPLALSDSRVVLNGAVPGTDVESMALWRSTSKTSRRSTLGAN